MVVSLRASAVPPAGARPRAWAWDDVLDAPPPRRAHAPPAGRFVVRHGQDDDADPDVRLGYATVVEAREGTVVVDERVGVERRVLSRALRAERAVGRGLERGAAVGARAVEGSTRAVGGVVGGRPGRVLATGGRGLAQGVAWAAGTVRDGLHALVAAPDRVRAGAGSAEGHLRARRERRALLRGLLDPYALTREGKAAALFLAGAGLAAVLVLVTLLVALLRPQAAETWTDVLGAFLLALASTLFLPTFPELRLRVLAADVGLPFAVLTLVAGMAVGAWFVLFLGDAIHRSLHRSLRPGSRVERLLARAEAFAKRRGFLAAAVALAIPLGPDTPVFYVLATVRTPPRAYLAGVVVGLTVRFVLWALVPLAAA